MNTNDNTSRGTRLQLSLPAQVSLRSYAVRVSLSESSRAGGMIKASSRPGKGGHTQKGQGLCQQTGSSALKFLTTKLARQSSSGTWTHQHLNKAYANT